MSNGDDVLDNWEEIDEAGLHTSVNKLKTLSASSVCERITTNVSATAINTFNNTATLTTTPRPLQMKLLQRSTNPPQQDPSATVKTVMSSVKSPLDDMSATFQPVMMVLHKPQDEYQSANYTPPIANQTVKILRRPTQSTEPRNNGIRPKQPIKTLQQREQEYAEARLRILGSAKNPEDDDQKASSTTTTSITTSTTNSTPSTPTATVAALTNNSITNMVTTNTATTKINSPKTHIQANQYNNHYNQQLQQQQQQQYQQNYQQQQQQQQNYYYQQQQQQPPTPTQQQQQPQSPAFNNNRTYNTMNPLLNLGPMGAIGQPAQYQATQTQQQQQQHLKYQQQYHQKSPQQQHKQQTWSPVVGGSVSSSNTSVRQQQNETILRLPRGPDGTTGFQMRR